jgi:hypothetical protein
MINNKISKLKNIIQVYTNTETMINNKLAVEWLAKSYVDLLTKLNNDEISLKEFEIQYIEILEQAKEMEKEQTINFTEDWYFNGPLLGEGIDVKNTIEQHFNNTYGDDKQ